MKLTVLLMNFSLFLDAPIFTEFYRKNFTSLVKLNDERLDSLNLSRPIKLSEIKRVASASSRSIVDLSYCGYYTLDTFS